MADTLLTGTTLVEKESRSIGDVPIGGIIPWAKSLTGVPNLAEGWVECDGATLVDSQSSLNGQTIPDLNGGVFLEGQATSGATGGSATMAHTHGATTLDVQNMDAAGAGYDVMTLPSPTTDQNPITAAASNAENRPPFYTVVWIMRVR